MVLTRLSNAEALVEVMQNDVDEWAIRIQVSEQKAQEMKDGYELLQAEMHGQTLDRELHQDSEDVGVQVRSVYVKMTCRVSRHLRRPRLVVSSRTERSLKLEAARMWGSRCV